MQRYVVNQVSYGTYAPECTQVMSKSKCLKNPIFSRGVELEKITNPAITLDRVDYLERWSKNMSNRTFGIFGHRSFDPHRYIYVVMILGLFLGAIGFIRYVNKKDIGILILLFFSSFYIFVLLRQHYSEYLRTGIAELAVQGRYSFAVLPLVYIIALHYTLKLLRHNSLRLAYILCLLTLFLASCLPTFIIRSGPGWSEPRIEQFP